jgi:hypothetical protein
MRRRLDGIRRRVAPPTHRNMLLHFRFCVSDMPIDRPPIGQQSRCGLLMLTTLTAENSQASAYSSLYDHRLFRQ